MAQQTLDLHSTPGHEPANVLRILRSSAGSGKTYALVRQYLLLVLPRPADFRSILAITFTNKATAEMKRRIVERLFDLSQGKAPTLAADLQRELPGLNLRAAAAETLTRILHDYSHFGVRTIDSFFYSVVRAFQRELGILAGTEIDMDAKGALAFATDQLLDEVGDDKDLTDWLARFVFDRMEDGKSWLSYESALQELGNKLLEENADVLFAGVDNYDRFRKLVDDLRQVRRDFERDLSAPGIQALQLMAANGLSVKDFAYGDSGPAGWLAKIAAGELAEPKARAQKAATDSASWFSKAAPKRLQIEQLAEQHLMRLTAQAIAVWETGSVKLRAAGDALKMVYALPLMGRLNEKLRDYRAENRVMLTADISRWLRAVVKEDPVQFIYEKAGVRYRHFLLDEFQDTSRGQWASLQPLLSEALSNGGTVLVVGDAKQSVYRWRGGEASLLQGLEEEFPQFSTLISPERLSTNWRSGGNIIAFNNAFFQAASAVLSQKLQQQPHELLASFLPDGLVQEIAAERAGKGYVQVEFLPGEFADMETGEVLDGWKRNAEARLLDILRGLRATGYAWDDIALLVRSNSEGSRLVRVLMEQADPIPVVSAEALQLSGSPIIQALISALHLLAFPDPSASAVHRAHLCHFVLRQRQLPSQLLDKLALDLTADQLWVTLGLDELHNRRAEWLRLPLYELVERIVALLFAQGATEADPYLLRFLDLVQEFSRKEGSDLLRLLEWWERKGAIQSVESGDQRGAVTIMTHHKAKGLEFPVVILPYADWNIEPRYDSIIWGSSTEAPYADFPTLPLPGRPRIADNDVFAADHLREIRQTHLDNLNLLYVALTRPVDQLYLLAPQLKPETETRLSSVGAVLSETLRHMRDALPGLTSAEGIVRFGLQERGSHPSVTSDAELRLYRAAGSDTWRRRLTVRRRADVLEGLLTTETLPPAVWGQLLHALLADIQVPEDAFAALQKLRFQGIVSENHLAQLEAQVLALLAHPDVQPLFSRGWIIRSECDIILPEGEVLRPDRVLESHDGNEAWVIDFKSGQPLPAHDRQVKRYAAELMRMGYQSVKGQILYVNPVLLKDVSRAGSEIA